MENQEHILSDPQICESRRGLQEDPKAESRSFHFFNKLPPEIRVRIWKRAAFHTPRIIDLRIQYQAPRDGEIYNGTYHTVNTKQPAILQINREGRGEGLKIYEPFLGIGVKENADLKEKPRLYINYNIDSVIFSEPEMFMATEQERQSGGLSSNPVLRAHGVYNSPIILGIKRRALMYLLLQSLLRKGIRSIELQMPTAAYSVGGWEMDLCFYLLSCTEAGGKQVKIGLFMAVDDIDEGDERKYQQLLRLKRNMKRYWASLRGWERKNEWPRLRCLMRYRDTPDSIWSCRYDPFD